MFLEYEFFYFFFKNGEHMAKKFKTDLYLRLNNSKTIKNEKTN
jgi:hypothetical protein